MVESFEPFGVTKPMIEDFCQCRIEAIRPAQVVRLKKVYVSLRDGMAVAADFFKTEPKEAPKIEEKKSLKDKLKTKAAEESAAPLPAADPATGEVKKEITDEDLLA